MHTPPTPPSTQGAQYETALQDDGAKDQGQYQFVENLYATLADRAHQDIQLLTYITQRLIII